LIAHRINTARNFLFTLRVGSMPTSRIHADGYAMRIAKTYRNPFFAMPVLVGSGLAYAEAQIKGVGVAPENENESGRDVDLGGMECRWDRVAPPRDTQEIVCLLVNVLNQTAATAVMRRVLDQLDTIYGPHVGRNPITTAKLKLNPSFAAINRESRTKLGRFDWRYALEHWLRTALIGAAFLRYTKDGQGYAATVPELSDTLTIDGRINTVMSGTSAQRAALTTALATLEADGDIIFGLYASSASIMSCYVRDRREQHIHFVDGADGGFTQAAKMLKSKLGKCW
jgi:hypothetical protein